MCIHLDSGCAVKLCLIDLGRCATTGGLVQFLSSLVHSESCNALSAARRGLPLPCSIALHAAVGCLLRRFWKHQQANFENLRRRALLQCVMLPALRFAPVSFQADVLKGWVPHLISVASPDTQPGSIPGLRR